MTQQAVTEPEAGTTPEVVEPSTSTTKAGTPATKEQVSPEDEPKYSQKQLDLMLQQATSEAGRQRAAAEQERDTLKSQIQTKESELGDIQAERDSLQTQIEGLTENDPKKFDLVKLDKQLRERERQHKANIRTLEEEKTKVNAGLEKVSAFEAEVLMETIADEYEDGDKAQLQSMCKTTGAKTEETIRQIANILWGKAKTPTGTKKTLLKKVSGITKGGGTESLSELLKVNIKKLSYQERIEHQKKLNAFRSKIT